MAVTHRKYAELLRQRCNIYTHVTTTDPLTGQVREEWEIIARGVPCLIQPITGTQALQEQGLEIVSDYKAFLLFSQEIKLRDKIIFENKTFYVNYIFSGWSGRSDHKEINLKMEVTTGAI